MPLKPVSDNIKTFKSAEKKLVALFDLPDVQEYLARKRILWRYNLPTASWWGGLFERLIEMTKRCLCKIIGRASLTYDEINTVIVEVECVLNSRPLTYVSAEDQEEILTPSHLLNGRNISSLPELNEFREILHDPDYEIEKRELFTKRAIHLSNVLKHFWNLWRKHYLVELCEHHNVKGRVTGKSSIINVGDIVTVQEGVKKGFWKIGKIVNLIKGHDDIVRGAEVRICSKGRKPRTVKDLYKNYSHWKYRTDK